jgi:hypothetical protein
MSVISALGRWRQKDGDLEASLGCTVRHFFCCLFVFVRHSRIKRKERQRKDKSRAGRIYSKDGYGKDISNICKELSKLRFSEK